MCIRDNQWTTATNWSPARVPLATDDVCINTQFAGTTFTMANSVQTVHSLTAASNFVLSGATTAASLTVAANSVFLNALTLNGATLSSAGNLALDGPFTSSGTSSIGGTTGVRANAGLTVAANGTLTVTGTTLVNFGSATLNSTLQLSGGATLDNNSSLTINNASIPTSSGSSVINRAGATINVTGSSVTSTISVPVTNLGTVSVGSTAALSLFGGYTQTSGVTALSGGGITNNSSLNINGGLLTGTGVIGNGGAAGVSVASGGTVSPGFSPGTITVQGPYTQATGGTYNAEIGGLTAGTQYDQIKAASASLNGTLNVSLINGFVPVAGNSFTILSGNAGLSGTFSTVNLPGLPNGLNWTVKYGPTSVVLSVGATAAGCAAGSNQWTGAAGDNQWGTAGNWSNGAVPIATDNVCIGTAFSSSTVNIGSLGTAANQTIASLIANSTINFTSGPLTVTGAATFANALNISGGTLTLNGTSAVQGATNLSGGTLSGSGNVTLTGLLSWTNGVMNGTGATNANGVMSFTSPQSFLDTRTLNVSGATTFGSTTAGASLLMQNGAVINNLAGATWLSLIHI